MKLRVPASCVALVVLGLAATLSAEGTKSGVRINLDEPEAASAKPQPSAAQPKAARPATPAAGAKATPSAKPAAPKAGVKKDEPPAKVEGFEIARGERGFLGLTVQNNTFRMTFYGPDKKPVAPDVTSVALRWPVNYQKNDERTTLLPSGDGKTFVSEKIVRPPFSFKLFITLLKDGAAGGDLSPETYVVDFRG
jgi:pyruvate/2-oxoglutarate dehydrogenase complex dihydrolipoamide acyltransferase (E2) component